MLQRVAMRRAWIAAALLAGCVPSRSAVFGPVDRDVQRRVGIGVTWTEESRTSGAIDALLALLVPAIAVSIVIAMFAWRRRKRPGCPRCDS
jgi:hypothetical protein